ncbi:MAG: 30S ribosomal protein S20 [Algisphaera sp.]
MANSLSAKKRIKQNVRSRARNRWVKAGFRTKIKAYQETLLHGSVEQAETELKGIYKALDQAAASPALHKNTASRYKSRLSAKLNAKRSA